MRSWASCHDIVVAHGSKTLPVSVLSTLAAPAPIIYVNIGDPLAWAGTRMRMLRTRLLYRRVEAVAAISPKSAAVLSSRFGVPAEKLRVIPNGRDEDFFHPPNQQQRLDARAALGFSANELVVAFVGALAQEKRVDHLVRAVATMAPTTRLLIAGDGPLRGDLETLALRIGCRAHFLGQVSDVRKVYHASDVLALPSRTEGLPGVLIEAGLSGLPVVATRVGMVDDIVEAGSTGELVPCDVSLGALTSALSQAAAARSTYGQTARIRCESRFGLTSVAEAWLELLETVEDQTMLEMR
jgi:glycosyltransferase involved in cell wall biosynthesis